MASLPGAGDWSAAEGELEPLASLGHPVVACVVDVVDVVDVVVDVVDDVDVDVVGGEVPY